MKKQCIYNYFLEKYHDSLYGFLFTLSVSLSDYCSHKNDLTSFVEIFKQACSKSPFFIRMNNASSLVASDEKTRLIIRLTQDFLYGLNEIACHDCACETVSHDQKEKMVSAMIQKYVQRVVSFCDLAHFEKQLPEDLRVLFIEHLHDLIKGLKSRQEVHTLLQNFDDNLDENLLIQSYIFVNYIACLKIS